MYGGRDDKDCDNNEEDEEEEGTDCVCGGKG